MGYECALIVVRDLQVSPTKNTIRCYPCRGNEPNVPELLAVAKRTLEIVGIVGHADSSLLSSQNSDHLHSSKKAQVEIVHGMILVQGSIGV